jgi:hypothetical protein
MSRARGALSFTIVALAAALAACGPDAKPRATAARPVYEEPQAPTKWEDADAGPNALPPMNADILCEAYERAGRSIAGDLSARASSGPLAPEEGRALVQRATPDGAAPVLRTVIREMKRDPEEVMRWALSHADANQRCADAMVAKLQPIVQRVARASRGISWRTEADVALEEAASQKRRALYVACAEWLGACRELERTTFSSAAVMSPLVDGRVVPIYDDMSDFDGADVDARRTKLKITALPTIILFDAGGREVKRWTAYVTPEALGDELRGAPASSP